MDRLLKCGGKWHGTSTLQDPEMGLQPDTSSSTLTVEPMLDGRFVRIDYTWSYHDKPQAGSMLIGFQTKSGVATVHWIDSWHNGEKVMACEGAAPGGTINVRGSYSAPPGPGLGLAHRDYPGPAGVARHCHAQHLAGGPGGAGGGGAVFANRRLSWRHRAAVDVGRAVRRGPRTRECKGRVDVPQGLPGGA